MWEANSARVGRSKRRSLEGPPCLVGLRRGVFRQGAVLVLGRLAVLVRGIGQGRSGLVGPRSRLGRLV